MAATAAAAYLATLAKLQHISFTRIAKLTGIHSRYLWRVENGQIVEPGASDLLAVADVVKAELRELQALLLDKHADASDGHSAAVSSAVRRGLVDPRDARILKSASREEIERAARDLLDSLE